MERIYTILLDKGGTAAARHRRSGVPAYDQAHEAAGQFMADPPRPAIHRERLNAQELQELAQEPEFVAAAEIIRTKLLSPVADAPLASTRAAIDAQRRHSWGVAAVGADRSKFTGADVPVAILDTGIDAHHPAFREVDLVERDFTGCGNGDADGHGTHCAGILFGRNVDGIRIGIAPGVRKAFIGKILEGGSGDSDMLMRGILWAHEQAARVISLSVGFDFAATVAERQRNGWGGELATGVTLEAYRANLWLLDRLLHMLRLQEPYTGGAILVAAAGNDSSRGAGGDLIMSSCPPSGSDMFISVGSLDPDPLGGGYRVSSFSNSNVEIIAPGHMIVSAAAGGGLKVLSGTSVAAPHVAGVAALWWQAVRQSDLPASAAVVRDKLLGSAQSKGFSPSVYPVERGAGRVSAPEDGLALVASRSAERRMRCRENGDFGGEAAPRVLAVNFEAISIDFHRAALASPGGRRNLC